MQTKELIGLVVVGLVGCIIVAGFIPVLNETVDPDTTFTNHGVYNMTSDPTDYKLEYKGTLGEIWVNDELVTTTAELPAEGWTLISTPDVFIRLQNFSAQSYNLWLFTIAGGNAVIGNNTNASVIVTATENSITVGTNEPVTYDGEFRGIAKTGNYVMTRGGEFVVSNTDTIIVGNGTTVVTHWYDMFYMIGTVNDMTVSSNPSITVSNVNVNTTPLNGYIGGSTVNSITFTATDGENTANATYTRVIVPAEVTLEKSAHADDATASMIALLPLILIMGIVIMFVGVVLVRRYV